MRFSSYTFFLIAAAMFFSACAPAETPNPTLQRPAPSATNTPAKPKILRINLGTRPDVLDPQKASTSGEIAVLQLAYEGLARLDESGKVIPGAAESWEFSSDGKALTFHLRNGIVRVDGTPLTAKDFEYAFKHSVDPRVFNVDQSFLDDVHGALTAYSIDPKSRPEDIQKALDNVGISSPDDSTLVISFDKPTGFWPTIASTWVGWPSDRSKIDKDPDAWWIKPENHNGNGPFKISDIQDQAIKLVPNPNYWGGQPKLARVEFYWVADPAAAIDAYRNGDFEIIRIAPDNFAQVQADSQLNKDLIRNAAARVTYLGFNVKKPPFTDKNVRTAFSQALDREGFVRDVLKGLGKAYLSWIPPGIPGYDESASVPGFDAKAAVQTLVNGNYGTADKKKVDCNKLGTIKLSYSNTPRNQLIFQFIVGSLARTFGCPILLDPIEPSIYPVALKDSRTAPQVFLITWEQEYPHPQNWLFLQTCTGVYATRIGYCNREFDAAYATANQELDYERAIEKYKAAQRIFAGDLAAAFLWNNENAYLVKPYVLGLAEHRSTSDNAWPGQFGPVLSYDIDTAKVGAGYPNQ